MKIYEGRRVDGSAVVEVTSQGETIPLSPGPSLRIRNHSPTGFEWGYPGSGPAQLALALLLHCYPERGEDWAAEWHQKFKAAVVQNLAHEGWRLTGAQIAAHIRKLEDNWSPGKFDREAPTAPERARIIAMPSEPRSPAEVFRKPPVMADTPSSQFTKVQLESMHFETRGEQAAYRTGYDDASATLGPVIAALGDDLQEARRIARIFQQEARGAEGTEKGDGDAAVIDRIEELEARLRNAHAALRLARGALLFEDEGNAQKKDEEAVKAIDEALGDPWVDPQATRTA